MQLWVCIWLGTNTSAVSHGYFAAIKVSQQKIRHWNKTKKANSIAIESWELTWFSWLLSWSHGSCHQLVNDHFGFNCLSTSLHQTTKCGLNFEAPVCSTWVWLNRREFLSCTSSGTFAKINLPVVLHQGLLEGNSAECKWTTAVRPCPHQICYIWFCNILCFQTPSLKWSSHRTSRRSTSKRSSDRPMGDTSLPQVAAAMLVCKADCTFIKFG